MALKGFDSLKGFKARVTHTAKEQEKERAQQVQAQLKAEEDHHEFEAEMRRMGVKVEKKKENAADLFAQEMARLGVVKMGESAPRPTRRRAEPIPRQKLLDEKRVLTESLSDEFDCGTYLEHDEDLFFVRPGIGEDVVKKLRRGFWSIQAHIDLHGMRTDDARDAVATFIHKAVMHDLRCVRIVHGKGLNSQGAPILKIRTRRWLRQKEEVLAYVEAPPEDGGSGAVRILLAKRTR